jgi:predicted porin
MVAMRRLSLTTSAVVSAGLVAPGALAAAEVRPGGALDVTVSGFVRGLAIGGDVDNLRLDPTFSNDLDFFNDTEVHVLLKGKHDATGIEYGGTVELEADTNQTSNTDETWLFLRGGFGEVRLGDEDGTSDSDGLAVSANTISQDVGTGGLDGDQFEVLAGSIKTFESTGTSDATKIRYQTPSFGGLQFGASYTPNLNGINSGSGNGDLLAITDLDAGDVVEGGVRYKGKLGALGLTAASPGCTGTSRTRATTTGSAATTTGNGRPAPWSTSPASGWAGPTCRKRSAPWRRAPSPSASARTSGGSSSP